MMTTYSLTKYHKVGQHIPKHVEYMYEELTILLICEISTIIYILVINYYFSIWLSRVKTNEGKSSIFFISWLIFATLKVQMLHVLLEINVRMLSINKVICMFSKTHRKTTLVLIV